MSNFKAKMHQIRFRLGLRPRPAGGAYSVPPDPIAGFKGCLLLRGERGAEGKGRGREGRGKEKEKGGKRERRREGKAFLLL